MPLLKDGSFLLDDSSCDPYEVVGTSARMANMKKEKPRSALKTDKKNGKVKKK